METPKYLANNMKIYSVKFIDKLWTVDVNTNEIRIAKPICQILRWPVDLFEYLKQFSFQNVIYNCKESAENFTDKRKRHESLFHTNPVTTQCLYY